MGQTDMRTVPLGGKKAAGRVALVDDADYDLVMAYRWHIQTSRTQGLFYALTNVLRPGTARRTSLKMNTLLTGWPRTDHIDHDGLNNQRRNLRPVTDSQNLMNQRVIRGGTSRFKGVFHNPDFSPRYRAYIGLNGNQHWLGWFDDEISAALAYDAAARELFKEYAEPNFPEAVYPHPEPHKRKCSSAYRGVSWDRTVRKWRARIGGRLLGYFTDEEAAAHAYDTAATAAWGPHGRPNFPEAA